MNKDALWLWFTGVFGISSKRNNRILEHYKNVENLLRIPERVLMEDENFKLAEKKEIIMFEPSRAERKLEILKKKGIYVISVDNPLYPQMLKTISDPPYLLYCAGNPESLNESYPITMVGTRKPDPYGLKSAHDISYELSSMGAAIISGLAEGCDKSCHMGALEAGGKTIGVCACGINVDYPSKEGPLKREICKNGAIISEFPLSYPVRQGNFSIRNRILSGLSLATVVIQCKKKSGTMLTANHALNQNRDVYALTGDPFNPLTEGPLSLINDGASPFISSREIISHYAEIYNIPLSFPERKKASEKKEVKEVSRNHTVQASKREKTIPDDTPDEFKKILSILGGKSLHIDELASIAGMPSHRLLASLTEMELMSLVKALPGGMYKAV